MSRLKDEINCLFIVICLLHILIGIFNSIISNFPLCSSSLTKSHSIMLLVILVLINNVEKNAEILSKIIMKL